MSYGVNRAAKRSTTRRRKRRPSNGRVRGAAKTRSRATSTRRAGSARRAPKRSGSTRATTRRRTAANRGTTSSRSRKKKAAPRAKKARLYTRYDPETGQKVRVPAGTYEYLNWVSRKPSKKKIARAALKADPLGYIGQAGVIAGTRAAEKVGERVGRSILRKYGGVAATTAAAAAAELGGATLAIGALPIAAAIGGALLYYSTQPGAEENKLSLQFVAAQKALIQETHARDWAGVPIAARTRLLDDYKHALQRIAEVRAATTLQQSNRYRKG